MCSWCFGSIVYFVIGLLLSDIIMLLSNLLIVQNSWTRDTPGRHCTVKINATFEIHILLYIYVSSHV